MATATETDTLSLPTSTAPTDFSESTCMPNVVHPFASQSQSPCPCPATKDADADSPMTEPPSSAAAAAAATHWDTSIIMNGIHRQYHQSQQQQQQQQRQHNQHPQHQFASAGPSSFGRDSSSGSNNWPSVVTDNCADVDNVLDSCSDDNMPAPGCGTGCFNDGGKLYRAQAEKECREGPGKSVEEACKRSLDHFPCPGVVFPMPALDFDFRIAVRLNREPCHAGAGAAKEITTVAAGVWSGSFGHGRVLAGGYDLGQARGFRPMRLVEGAFVVQTSDETPAVLEMRTRGSLSGPSDILDSLLSPRNPKDIDPRRYGFRMFATIKTADKRYAEIVNCGLWVASGAWRGEHLVIDAYRVT